MSPTDSAEGSIGSLYESDTYVVVHMRYVYPGGHEDVFELVDKKREVSVLLHGMLALAFHRRIQNWQVDPPDQSVVENTIDSFTVLGHHPLWSH